ncbi:MAG: sulfotransferase [Candidatus Dormibacteraeota bacterium]|nr:sulfotransferase [Candidatus Dormibacteraeota bacterium]
MSRVLYIGGCTRSGSTLVDRMLGQIPGFLSTGEFGLLTTHSLVENRLCGCGKRFMECDFWQAVGEAAFGGWESAEARELVALHPQVTRQRHLPLLFAPGLSASFSRKLRRYQQLLGRMYDALHTVSGDEVIIDSTKAPAYALVLRGVPGMHLSILQLVRDSRGTAYSATKKQIMRDSVDRVVYKHSYAPAVITMRWNVYHLLFDVMRALGARVLVARYEDVVHEPRTLLGRIAAFAGRPTADGDLDFISPSGVVLSVDHTAVGNDMRFEHGNVVMREDDAWVRSLPRSSRRVVTLLSWPLLKRWKYN